MDCEKLYKLFLSLNYFLLMNCLKNYYYYLLFLFAYYFLDYFLVRVLHLQMEEHTTLPFLYNFNLFYHLFIDLIHISNYEKIHLEFPSYFFDFTCPVVATKNFNLSHLNKNSNLLYHHFKHLYDLENLNAMFGGLNFTNLRSLSYNTTLASNNHHFSIILLDADLVLFTVTYLLSYPEENQIELIPISNSYNFLFKNM